MANHIFLTGEKHVGKSTLIKKILEQYQGEVDGILSVRTKEYLGDRFSVHMYRYKEDHIPTEENLLFHCGEISPQIIERFDYMAYQTLNRCSGYTLLLMDELGPHEAQASRFRKAVLDFLDGDTPILGILQAPAEEFWPEITSHPSVKVIELSKKNRDDDTLVRDILFHITK